MSSFSGSIDQNTKIQHFKTKDFYDEIDGILCNVQRGKVLQCWLCDHKPFQLNSSVNHYSNHIINKHQYQFIRHTSNLGKEKIQAIDHALIIFLIFSFSPFSIVLNKYFRNFVHELNPEYRLPDRKTLNKLLWQLYDEFKENSIKYFKTIKWVHSTCDTWTSCSNNNYLGITLHFLNDFYELKSFTLSLKNVIGDHTAENLNFHLKSVFEEFCINNKVVSINSDNANNMRKVMRLYQEDEDGILIMASRCIGHTLQLIVQNVLEAIETKSSSKANQNLNDSILEIIAKCKNLTTSFNHSSQLNDKLVQKQLESGKNKNQTLRVIQEVKTRWHSLFSCLKRISMLHFYISDILTRYGLRVFI